MSPVLPNCLVLCLGAGDKDDDDDDEVDEAVACSAERFVASFDR